MATPSLLDIATTKEEGQRGFFEIADLTIEHWLGPAIGVEHGVFAWGLGQVLKSVVDIIDGVEGLAGG